jgi:hypothetical protein
MTKKEFKKLSFSQLLDLAEQQDRKQELMDLYVDEKGFQGLAIRLGLENQYNEYAQKVQNAGSIRVKKKLHDDFEFVLYKKICFGE